MLRQKKETATLWPNRCHRRVLFTLVSPWSLSCQRSCTPSLRTNWTGTSPRGNARRRRKRRGTVSTRRSMTKRWRPQRSRCSLLKLSYCQRRYWKSDPHQKLGHLCLLCLGSPSSESRNKSAPLLSLCFVFFFSFHFNYSSVVLLRCCTILSFLSFPRIFLGGGVLRFKKTWGGLMFLPQVLSQLLFLVFQLQGPMKSMVLFFPLNFVLFLAKFHFFSILVYWNSVLLPFLLILPSECGCRTLFSLFCSWALDHKWSLHVSTRFQTTLCWQKSQSYCSALYFWDKCCLMLFCFFADVPASWAACFGMLEFVEWQSSGQAH